MNREFSGEGHKTTVRDFGWCELLEPVSASASDFDVKRGQELHSLQA